MDSLTAAFHESPEWLEDPHVVWRDDVPNVVVGDGVRIEAEAFAFAIDRDGINWGSFRSPECDTGTAVDTAANLPPGDGCHVGWNWPHEQLFYDISVPTDGTWLVHLRVATARPGRTVRLTAGGTEQTARVRARGFRFFTNVTFEVELTAGPDQLEVNFPRGFVKFDYLEFEQPACDLPTNVTPDALGPPATTVTNARGEQVHAWAQDCGDGTSAVAGARYVDGAWQPPVVLSRPVGAVDNMSSQLGDEGDAVVIWRESNGSPRSSFTLWASYWPAGAAPEPVERIAPPSDSLSGGQSVMAVDGSVTVMWTQFRIDGAPSLQTLRYEPGVGWTDGHTLDNGGFIETASLEIDPAGNVFAGWVVVNDAHGLNVRANHRSATGSWDSATLLGQTDGDETIEDTSLTVRGIDTATFTWTTSNDDVWVANHTPEAGWAPAVLAEPDD